jgi:hypothetical protein
MLLGGGRRGRDRPGRIAGTAPCPGGGGGRGRQSPPRRRRRRPPPPRFPWWRQRQRRPARSNPWPGSLPKFRISGAWERPPPSSPRASSARNSSSWKSKSRIGCRSKQPGPSRVGRSCPRGTRSSRRGGGQGARTGGGAAPRPVASRVDCFEVVSSSLQMGGHATKRTHVTCLIHFMQ